MQYRLLGPLEVTGHDGEVDIAAPKQRAALAVLLLDAGRVVPTGRIVAAIWGDDPPPAAASSLEASVSKLRRALTEGTGRAPIERRANGYVLRAAPAEIDAEVFVAAATGVRELVERGAWPEAARRARSALAMWRGPVLGDLAEEPWVRVDAEVWQVRRSEVRQHLVTALLGCDRAIEAVGEAERLRADEPLDDRVVWLQMIALLRAGRAAEALEIHRRHAAHLARELGIEPSAAVRDLQAAVLRQDPDLVVWPKRPAAARATAAVQPDQPDPQRRNGLVGRRRQLADIEDLFGAPADGQRWLVLTGPAGIGKTRLADETADALEKAGSRVLRAACPEDEGTPPWWPVRQLLRGLGEDPDALLTPPPDTGADVGRFLVYERLEGVLRAAEGPLALLVDDAQWSDHASLRWLAYLATSSGPLRLDVVLTIRDEAPRAPLESLTAAVARAPAMRQIAVPPLNVVEVAELAVQVNGEELGSAAAAELAARTGGNPFFVGEYARLPRDERAAGDLPVAIRSVLRRRIAGVDPDVLGVLRIAAVAGDPIDVELLRTVTRVDDDELADLLDEAAAHDLIVPLQGAGPGYRFAHGLLRDEVLSGLSARRRQRLHVRIAAALEVGTHMDDRIRRATHLMAALPLADARVTFEACRSAARAAEEGWASDTAAEWWAHASAVSAMLPEQDDEERDDLLVARVTALGRDGRRETVITVVEAALLDALRHARIDSAGRLAAMTLRISGIWPWTSCSDDPGPLLTRLADLEPLVRPDPAAHARVLAALAVGTYDDPDPGVPDRLSVRAVEVAEAHADPDVLADALLGRALTLCGRASRAAEAVEVAARLAAVPHRSSRIDDVLLHDLLTLTCFTLGDVDRAEAHLQDGVAGADALRLPIVRAQLRWMDSNLALWHGDLDRAARTAEMAALHHRTELSTMTVDRFARLGQDWERGDLAGVAHLLTTAAPRLPWLAATLPLAAGDRAGVAAQVAAVDAQAPREVWTTLGELTMAAFLVAHARLAEAAPVLLRRLEPHRHQVASFGQTGNVGVVALAVAHLQALLGQHDAARVALAEARAIAEHGASRSTLVRCRLLEAQLDDAGPVVFAAIAADAEALGMLGIAAEARFGAPDAVQNRNDAPAS